MVAWTRGAVEGDGRVGETFWRANGEDKIGFWFVKTVVVPRPPTGPRHNHLDVWCPCSPQ